MDSQNKRVLKYLEYFGSITQLEALRDLGVLRLASRIFDLKQSGVAIVSDFEDVTNRYGETVSVKRYRLQKGE